MMRAVYVVLGLLLGGCTIVEAPLPDLPPVTAFVMADTPPDVPPDAVPPTPELVVFTPPALPVAPPPKVARVERLKDLPAPRPEPVPQPTAMIKEAQRVAQVEPQARGFHGQSATQRWIWQPGKLYVVYVSPGQMTKIALPPGELLVSKVFLDPELWDVQSYRVGNEMQTQDVVFVRPLEAKEGKGAKDVDLALLTEQGHSYDVHLKVGSMGMFAVTWDTPTVPQLLLDDQSLRSKP
jgi:hypothetical protein